MTEAEKRIRAALSVASIEPRDECFKVDTDDLTALLADRDEREAALRAEVERLKAAIDMQPSPPTREDMEWAGKVHLAEAEKENDALRAEVEALRADAERFRWLCDQELPDWMDLYHQHPYRLRERIDAAMAQAKDAEAR